MREHTPDNQHNAHERTPNEHHLPPADMVTEIDRERQTGDVAEPVPAREQRRLVTRESRESKHIRRIHAYEVDARAFLHDLHTRAQQQPPTGVQLVLLEEHAVETGRCGRRLGSDGEEDLIHLTLGGLGACIHASALQHRASRGEIPSLSEIPRRFRVERRGGEDDDKEDDLEAEREAPGEGFALSFDAGELHPVDAIKHVSLDTSRHCICVYTHIALPVIASVN